MKAVNLLPEKHRPRKPTGGQSKSGYVFLGVLGAVLVGVLVYVLTLNSINSSKTKITEATAEAARLNDQANSLGPYGDFAKIKAERVASVKQLAEGRFDYERMVRELAHVLPSDVWLVNASASSVGDPGATPGTTGSAAPAASAAPAPGAPAAPAPAPSLKLQGCARDQGQVAVTLVRLRELEGATDVSLTHSTAGQDNSTSGSGPAPVGATGAATGGDQSCGETHGKPNYSFEADVTFAPQTSSTEPGNVPRRLGGGA
jgi:Tfp pilus assembly protein PilN